MPVYIVRGCVVVCVCCLFVVRSMWRVHISVVCGSVCVVCAHMCLVCLCVCIRMCVCASAHVSVCVCVHAHMSVCLYI